MIDTGGFNAVNYLRTRNGYTMASISQKTGICTSDFVRLERGSKRCSLKTYIKLADFFGVPLWALLANDIVEILKYVLLNPERLSTSQKKQIRRGIGRMKSGNAGEYAALEYEIKRHLDAGAKDLNFIDPRPAEKSSNGFDMLSRTLDGKTLYIEVKSTIGGYEEPFFISAPELAKAAELEQRGELYLIYRVTFSRSASQREVIPMTLKEFWESFDLTPENFKVTLRGGN